MLMIIYMPTLKALPKNITLLFSLLLAAVSLQADERTLSGSDIQLEDGDTLVISINGKQQRIQLDGIDAPEDTDNPKLQSDLTRTGLSKDTLLGLGQQATDHLRTLIQLDPPFTLHFQAEQRDRYGRLMGDVSNASGHSFAELMIQHGYAQIAVKSIDPAQLKLLMPLQKAALDMNKGLWGLDHKASRLWAGIKATD